MIGATLSNCHETIRSMFFASLSENQSNQNVNEGCDKMSARMVEKRIKYELHNKYNTSVII